MASNHFYGWKKDSVDDRDFIYRMPQKVSQLPTMVDMRSVCSPVRNQGELGACTGFAVATGLREFMERKFYAARRYTTLSPLFLYYEERLLEGTLDYDAGAELRSGMKVLNGIGVSPESDWRYIPNNFSIKPTEHALLNAVKFHISSYQRLANLQDIKSALALKHGVVLGFLVYESFENGETELTGFMCMPDPGENVLGGHAVFCCGYVDNFHYAGGGYLIIKNSWGAKWGDRGYFYMPYAFVNSTNVGDIWTASA